MQVISSSPQETVGYGKKVGELLQRGDVVALNGDLGAGKTTFVQGVASGLLIEEYVVSSPTFVFIQIYEGRIPLFHVDLYRIHQENELTTLGLEEILNKAEGVTVIEWFDRFPTIWQDDYIRVQMDLKNDHERTIDILETGERSAELLQDWSRLV